MLNEGQRSSIPAYARISGELKEIGTLYPHVATGYCIDKTVKEALCREFPAGYSYEGQISGSQFTSVVFSAA
jgi:hypothetical protein